MPVGFGYTEDEQFFTGRLCRPGETIQAYSAFFDFRDAVTKRREFQRMRDAVLAVYRRTFGDVCHLQRPGVGCAPSLGLTVII